MKPPPEEKIGRPHLLSRREFIQAGSLAAASLLTPSTSRAASSKGIARIAIHPAIGIARVGNSRDSFFFGPEIPGALPVAPDGFKDKHGAIAKQAARFRIYALDRDGKVIRELTAADAQITWHVKVANSKAAWYEFGTAYDIPGSRPMARRNPDVQNRDALIIDPPQRTLHGANARPQKLDGGRFHRQDVNLGEVLTDAEGRLIFLPGSGAAYSTPSAPPLGGFSDNNGWTDDVCDGPVRATVRVNDRELTAEPAWVISAIPNYAPGISAGLVTLYDTIFSMELERGRVHHGRVDFDRDVMPIFERLVDMQWVNAGFLKSNGYGSSQYFTGRQWRQQLADHSKANRRFRMRIFREFRNPNYRKPQPDLVPQLYGDKTVMPPNDTDPYQWLAVTKHQYAVLRQWAHGHFDSATNAPPETPEIEDLPLQQQPRALDRAALEACLGGAFHPGIEFPWIARVRSVWAEPFRLKLRSLRPDTRNWGRKLDKDTALSADGPLDGCTPGDVTRWLGIPWHADGASCRSGYQVSISPVLPAFWPARIPNQVLSEGDYKIVMDRNRPLKERKEAFERRRDWERFIARRTRPPTLELMVKEWFRQGMVTIRPGPGDSHFPATIKVESLVGYKHEPEVSYPASDWVPQG